MNLFRHQSKHRQAGFTILEVLVAGLITGILAVSSFQFYASMHNQTLTQEEVSDMQTNCRAALYEIERTLRMGGYLLGDTHNPFEISGDSLRVFFNDSQPVDTVLYFLQEFSDAEYSQGYPRPQGMRIYKLMKKVNSQKVAVFADFIKSIRYTAAAPDEVMVAVTVESQKPDETFQSNHGYRTFTLVDRVILRNANL
jgi:type II secretory pathway pseudopilin PulG